MQGESKRMKPLVRDRVIEIKNFRGATDRAETKLPGFITDISCSSEGKTQGSC